MASNAAFSRRFHIIRIDEPDPVQTFLICKSWVSDIEKSIGIKISDEAIPGCAVELSSRFILDRHQPDKAIDLLEDAAASLRMNSLEVIPIEGARVVESLHIKALFEDQLGIKVNGFSPDPVHIRNVLESTIFGQQDAIDQITRAFEEINTKSQINSRVNLVFLLHGPARSGKYKAAQIIAEELFQKSDQILTIDLDEYSKEEDITRLRGVPPGFIGYDLDSPLTKFAFDVHQGAILLQNVEKAAPSVQEFIAQLLARKD